MILENVIEDFVVDAKYTLEFGLGNAILERGQIEERTREQQVSVGFFQNSKQISYARIDIVYGFESFVGLLKRWPFGDNLENDLHVEWIQLPDIGEFGAHHFTLTRAQASVAFPEPVLYDLVGERARKSRYLAKTRSRLDRSHQRGEYAAVIWQRRKDHFEISARGRQLVRKPVESIVGRVELIDRVEDEHEFSFRVLLSNNFEHIVKVAEKKRHGSGERLVHGTEIDVEQARQLIDYRFEEIDHVRACGRCAHESQDYRVVLWVRHDF